MHAYIKRVEAALAALRAGKMIVLTDHPDREDEGDIIFPAECITPEVINFMIRYCSGIICLSLMAEQLKKIGVDYMVPPHINSSGHKTPFTVSIEAKNGVTTGVSAQDRATTILTAVSQAVTSDDIVKPGHIFPLQAREGGVLERRGHTEGAIDIVALAGFTKAAVLCEVMNPDGTMARGEKLRAFAAEHQLEILSIEDIVNYRFYQENLIAEETIAELPLEKYGQFTISVIKEKFTNIEHVVLSRPFNNTNPLVRIHSACLTGDLFGSRRCDCNQQLHYALEKISQEGGMIIYLNQEGRGVGLSNKIKAYALQEKGLDTVEANAHLGLPIDARQYHMAANILKQKNIFNLRLLTNNPRKVEDLQRYGIEEVFIEKMPIFSNSHNLNYLNTKKLKLNHIINF